MEFRRGIEFATDLESSLFVLSRDEYERLPAVLVDVVRTYRRARAEKQFEEEETYKRNLQR